MLSMRPIGYVRSRYTHSREVRFLYDFRYGF